MQGVSAFSGLLVRAPLVAKAAYSAGTATFKSDIIPHTNLVVAQLGCLMQDRQKS